jgi:hypothetical protein
MVQRSASQQILAERCFPVRVRIAVPSGGFGSQFNVMGAWLDQHAGKSATSRARRPERASRMRRCSPSSMRRKRPHSLTDSRAGSSSAANRRRQ